MPPSISSFRLDPRTARTREEQAVATRRLPERPSLIQLRNLARDLQRGVRTGDGRALEAAALDTALADYPLHQAQLTIARSYGFVSWSRLRQHVHAIEERTWIAPPVIDDEPIADRFVRLATLTWDNDSPARRTEAAQLIADNPSLPDVSIATAAAAAHPNSIAAHLAGDPGAASRPVGPYGWSPLMYLAYARISRGLGATLTSAEALLDAGADPNDGRFFLGLPTPFTVLTGVIGGGELDQPPHPHWEPLARLLLSRGADPNDGQALYNRMFEENDDFLELLFEFGLGRGDGGPWHRRLPDLTESPTTLLRSLLGWAVTHDQRARVALLAANGVDVTSPLDAIGPLPTRATPIELAIANGHAELARQLRALGANEPDLDPVDAFIAAVLAGDQTRAHATPSEIVEAARQARPGLIVWATGQQRLDAIEFLLTAGWDINAMGRSDVPIEQPWQTALHTAVERGDSVIVGRLLELGANPELPDSRFDATPAGWAEHLGHPELLPLFGPQRSS
jgi:ankyrin repeat protein